MVAMAVDAEAKVEGRLPVFNLARVGAGVGGLRLIDQCDSGGLVVGVALAGEGIDHGTGDHGDH